MPPRAGPRGEAPGWGRRQKERGESTAQSLLVFSKGRNGKFEKLRIASFESFQQALG